MIAMEIIPETTPRTTNIFSIISYPETLEWPVMLGLRQQVQACISAAGDALPGDHSAGRANSPC
jgi:hypothetical protein